MHLCIIPGDLSAGWRPKIPPTWLTNPPQTVLPTSRFDPHEVTLRAVSVQCPQVRSTYSVVPFLLVSLLTPFLSGLPATPASDAVAWPFVCAGNNSLLCAVVTISPPKVQLSTYGPIPWRGIEPPSSRFNFRWFVHSLRDAHFPEPTCKAYLPFRSLLIPQARPFFRFRPLFAFPRPAICYWNFFFFTGPFNVPPVSPGPCDL